MNTENDELLRKKLDEINKRKLERKDNDIENLEEEY